MWACRPHAPGMGDMPSSTGAAPGSRTRALEPSGGRLSDNVDVERITPGSRSGSGNFRKIEKIIDFQSASFGMKIGLDGLGMCISHGAGSFAMGHQGRRGVPESGNMLGMM